MRARTSANQACGSTPFILGGDYKTIHSRSAALVTVGTGLPGPQMKRFKSRAASRSTASAQIASARQAYPFWKCGPLVADDRSKRKTQPITS